MRALRLLACGAALLSVIGASSASAANWDPLGVERTGELEGGAKFTTNAGVAATCAAGSTRLTPSSAPSDRVTTTAGIANPIALNLCTYNGFNASVTTFGTWELTATNTVLLDLTATGTGAGGTGPVVGINLTTFGGFTCSFTIDGPMTVPGTWTNVTTALDISTPTLELTPSSGCSTLIFGTTGQFDNLRFTVPGLSLT